MDDLFLKYNSEYQHSEEDIIIHNMLQELFDKVFDFSYSDFYNYITTEIGISDKKIEQLKKDDLYISDIDNKAVE